MRTETTYSNEEIKFYREESKKKSIGLLPNVKSGKCRIDRSWDKRSKKYARHRRKHPSSLERRIESFLVDNVVKFEKEWTRPDLIKLSRGLSYRLYFDFYLPEYKLFIEVDGIHHFKPIRGKAKLKTQKFNDSIKDKFCKRNNYNILRIPYFKIEEAERRICQKVDEICPVGPLYQLSKLKHEQTKRRH